MKWAAIEWIDVETGEILKTKEMKNRSYVIIKEEKIKVTWYKEEYKKIIRYVKINAIQQELWKQ